MAAYNGTEKYIFVSYAHKDNAVALPIIEGMISRGMRVWYDGGIEVGTDWAEFIEDRVLGCECLILLLSHASVESVNCREEFSLARETGKSILICYIEELNPSDLKHGLRLRVPTYQCMFLSRYADVDTFLDAVCRARILEGCGDAAIATVKYAESPMEEEARLSSMQEIKNGKAAGSGGIGPSASKVTPKTGEGAPSASEKWPKAESYPGSATDTGSRTESKPYPKSAADAPADGATRASTEKTDSIYSKGLDIRGGDTVVGIGSCRDMLVILPPHVREIKAGAFKGNKQITRIVLPEGITKIPDEAFCGCTSLYEVTVYGVTKIGKKAFCGCTSLHEVKIFGDLTEIDAKAFYGCKKLKSIDLPIGVRYIRDRAFMNCRELFLWTPSRLYELGERAFYGCYHVQGLFSSCIRRIGRLALGSRKRTYSSAVKFHGRIEEWRQVKLEGRIMSCRVQYVECNDGQMYTF